MSYPMVPHPRVVPAEALLQFGKVGSVESAGAAVRNSRPGPSQFFLGNLDVFETWAIQHETTNHT